LEIGKGKLREMAFIPLPRVWMDQCGTFAGDPQDKKRGTLVDVPKDLTMNSAVYISFTIGEQCPSLFGQIMMKI